MEISLDVQFGTNAVIVRSVDSVNGDYKIDTNDKGAIKVNIDGKNWDVVYSEGDGTMRIVTMMVVMTLVATMRMVIMLSIMMVKRIMIT